MWQDIQLVSVAKVTEANNVVVVHLMRRKLCVQNLQTGERIKLRKRKKGTFVFDVEIAGTRETGIVILDVAQAYPAGIYDRQ